MTRVNWWFALGLVLVLAPLPLLTLAAFKIAAYFL